MAGLRLTLVLVGFAIVAAKLPAEPFYVIAVVGAILTLAPVLAGFLAQLRGLSIEQIRDEMTYAAIAALPFAVLLGLALIVYLVGVQ